MIQERRDDALDAFMELLRRHGYEPSLPRDILSRALLVAIDTFQAPYETDPAFVFRYRNHRGKTQERHVLPSAVRYGTTEFHKDKWLLFAYDLDQQQVREFNLGDFGSRFLVGDALTVTGWSPPETAPSNGDFFIARYKGRKPFVAYWGDPQKTGERHWTDGYEKRDFDEWRHIPNDP